MSIVLSLISGKGGCGKTSLALSMASLLSACEVNCVVVDCDLSTNGATYFFESKLEEYNYNLRVFSDSISEVSDNKYQKPIMRIKKFFSFVPSIIELPESSNGAGLNPKGIRQFLYSLKDLFEVVILDCQAGYSDVLSKILPHTDIALTVMEADAVSSSAVRVLFLKIGQNLQAKKTYQVFNKTTQEEREIYSKVTGGTFFTNLGCISFDWRVRKAFSTLQIPDVDSTSNQFFLDLYDLCKSIFSNDSIRSKLDRYMMEKERKECLENIELLENKITENKKTKTQIAKQVKDEGAVNSLSFFIIFFLVIIATAGLLIVSLTSVEKGYIKFLLISIGMLSIISISILLLKKVDRSDERQMDQIKEIDVRIEELTSQMQKEKQVYTDLSKKLDENLEDSGIEQVL